MKHTQGPYEDYRLWSEEPWKDRISRIDPVVQYIGEHTVLDQQHCKAVLPDEESVKHTYDGKTGAYLYPEFFSEWKAKGITVVVKQITEHWMAAMPCAALPKSGPLRETLVVFLQGTYEDRFWPMHIAYAYDRYLEMAARENRIVIFVLSNGRADVERTYVNLLQEACCLFPCDTDKLYLDLSTVRGSGKKIRDLTDKPLAGRNGVLTGDTGFVAHDFVSLRRESIAFAARLFNNRGFIASHYGFLSPLGRTPPWAIGVTSVMLSILIPRPETARMALSRPSPIPLT